MRKLTIRTLVAALALTPAFAMAEGVNINTAGASTLEQLDGVGQARAQAIVEYREANGRFASVDELVEVDGIGDVTLESNRQQLTVE